MKEGYWIRTKDGQKWKVDEHATFAKRNGNEMGLPPRVQEFIAPLSLDFNGPDRQKIVVAVLQAGFIRMRGHGNSWSFEFYGNTEKNAERVMEFMNDWGGPYTGVLMNDIKTKSSWSGVFNEMQKLMQTEGPESMLRMGKCKLRFTAKFLRKAMATPRVNFRRVMDIVQKAQVGNGSWAVISPMRGGLSPEENSKRVQQIKQDLKGMGLGFREVAGVGQEEGGPNRETSFFIPKITLEQAKHLWQKYQQWGIVYGGPETKGQPTLMGPDESVDLGGFNPGIHGDYYTEVKGRPFTFTE